MKKRWIPFVATLLAALFSGAGLLHAFPFLPEAPERTDPYPRTALARADSALQGALRSRDAGLTLKWLIESAHYETELSRDSLPAVIGRVERIERSSSDPLLKSMLNSLLAELYIGAFEVSPVRYGKRPDLPEPTLSGMDEWSSRIFVDHIVEALQRSLEPAGVLQRTPLSAFSAALDTVAAPYGEMPTLFDFLSDRAIRLYAGLQFGMEPIVPQQPFPDSLMLAPADRFLRLEFGDDPYQIGRSVLKIYQMQLAACRERSRSALFFLSDLNRIDYAARFVPVTKGVSEAYRSALQALFESGSRYPWSIEAFLQLADRVPENRDAEARYLLEAADTLLARFPDASRIGCVAEVRNRLTAPHLMLKLPETVRPRALQPLSIEFRNLSDVSLVVSRLPYTAVAYRERVERKEEIRREPYLRKTIRLADSLTLISRKASLELPALPEGIYEVQIGDSAQACLCSGVVFVTPYLTLSKGAGGSEREILVVDSRTGKPQPGVRFGLYRSGENGSLVETGTTRSDRFGLARVDSSARFYAMPENDPAYPVQGLVFESGWVLGRTEREEGQLQIALFTDRSVYRPGQTLCFSGVAYELNGEERHVVADRPLTAVLRSSAGDSCGTLSLRSDSLGSFAGEFRLPADRLNGTYRLQVADQISWIEVAEYKRPTFRIAFDPVRESFDFKSPVTVTGRAVSYSGVELSGARVQYKVTRVPHWLRFWLPRSRNEVVATGETLTGETGEFTVRFTPRKTAEDQDQANVFYSYEIEASVTAPNGETQTRETLVSVGDARIVVRLTGPDKLEKERPAPIGVQVLNLNGVPVPVPCRYILYSLYEDESPFESKPLDSLKIRMQVYETDFQAPSAPAAPAWRKLPSGAYRLVVQAKDSTGRVVSGERSFVLYGKKDRKPPVPSVIWLPESHYTCVPGEHVDVVFGSSLGPVYLLCELFDGSRRVAVERRTADRKNVRYRVAYRKEYGPMLTLQISALINGKLYRQIVTVSRKEPNRRLTVRAESFRNKLLAGEHETWTFSVRDAAGNPVVARFMAELYDLSLDQLLPHGWSFLPETYRVPYFVNWSNPYSLQWLSAAGGSKKEKDAGICEPLPQSRFLFRFGSGELPRFGFYNGTETLIRGFSQSGAALRANKTQLSDASDGTTPVFFSETPKSGLAVQPPPETTYRVNRQETAFFRPLLATDANGEVSVSFTAPEVNTGWRFLSLAYTAGLDFGQLIDTVYTAKPVMVAPNLPRFVRQGDRVTIASLVTNTTDSLMQGIVSWGLFDPYADTLFVSGKQPVALSPKQTVPVVFTCDVPGDIDLAGIRIGVVTPTFSDGEQQFVPVLPARALVTDAMPFVQQGGETKTYTLKALRDNRSETLENYRLTLEFTGNPIWYVVQALPALSVVPDQDPVRIMAAYYGNAIASGVARQNPRIVTALRAWEASGASRETFLSNLQKNESLKNILLSETPWVLNAISSEERMRALGQLFDTTAVASRSRAALDRLRQLQGEDGGWSWYRGMPSSLAVTLNTLEGFVRLARLGMVDPDETVRTLQAKGLRYADDAMLAGRKDSSDTRLTDLRLFYLYVRVKYRDIPLTEPLLGFHKALVGRLRAGWSALSLPGKAMAAVVLNGYGFTDEARAVLRSLTEYATRDASLGMYWQNNRDRWNEGAVRVQTLVMAAYAEIDPDTPLLDEMKRWLLMQKQANDWGTFPATMDALYALLYRGRDWLGDSSSPFDLRWGGTPVTVRPGDPLTDYIQATKQGDAITPEAAAVTVTTSGSTPSWGALYWQYYEEFGRIRKSGSGISVDKQLFVESATGGPAQLVPVEKAALRKGDKVIVVLTVKTDRDLSYVHLNDQRAACFESAGQLSGYRCEERVCYFQENRDASTGFFFDSLPKGSYRFRYEVWIDRSGVYHNGITTVQCLYAPQYSAFTQGGVLIVR